MSATAVRVNVQYLSMRAPLDEHREFGVGEPSYILRVGPSVEAAHRGGFRSPKPWRTSTCRPLLGLHSRLGGELLGSIQRCKPLYLVQCSGKRG